MVAAFECATLGRTIDYKNEEVKKLISLLEGPANSKSIEILIRDVIVLRDQVFSNICPNICFQIETKHLNRVILPAQLQ